MYNQSYPKNYRGALHYAMKHAFALTDVDAEELAWDSVIGWLSRLRLLEGVPFQYIVPSEEMLPNESIRFFHMDRNWLDALVDGALSTGIYDSRGSLSDADPSTRSTIYQKLINELNEREVVMNPYRASLNLYDKHEHHIKSYLDEYTRSPDYKLRTNENAVTILGRYLQNVDVETGANHTGFLLRSTVVRDYPGLEICGYFAPALIKEEREKAYVEAYRLDTLRQVRLSDTIMLVIFKGIPSHLRMKEPGEGIKLSVEPMNGSSISSTWRFQVKSKDVNGDLMEESSTAEGTTYFSNFVRARKGTGDVSVLNILDLAAQQPNSGWDSHADSLEKGGYIATQLMSFPYQQDFQYDSISQSTVGQGHAKVNHKSIAASDEYEE